MCVSMPTVSPTDGSGGSQTCDPTRPAHETRESGQLLPGSGESQHVRAVVRVDCAWRDRGGRRRQSAIGSSAGVPRGGVGSGSGDQWPLTREGRAGGARLSCAGSRPARRAIACHSHPLGISNELPTAGGRRRAAAPASAPSREAALPAPRGGACRRLSVPRPKSSERGARGRHREAELDVAPDRCHNYELPPAKRRKNA